jgi:hypothetical protein
MAAIVCASSIFGTERSHDQRDPERDDVRQLTSLPGFDLLSHRLKVSLHSIDTNRNAIDQ